MLFLSHIALFFPCQMCQWQHFLDKLSYVGVESSCCDLQVTLSNDTALPRSHVKFNLLMKVLQKNQPTRGGVGKRATLLQTGSDGQAHGRSLFPLCSCSVSERHKASASL